MLKKIISSLLVLIALLVFPFAALALFDEPPGDPIYPMYSEEDTYYFYIDGEYFIATYNSDVYLHMYDKKVYYAKVLLNEISDSNPSIACGGNDSSWYYADSFSSKVTAFKQAAGIYAASDTINHYTWYYIKVYHG